MTQIQGKSILVRVSARFELPRVRVIGSRLYITGQFATDQAVMVFYFIRDHHEKVSITCEIKPIFRFHER